MLAIRLLPVFVLLTLLFTEKSAQYSENGPKDDEGPRIYECYTSADESTAARCPFGCIRKSIITSTVVDGEHVVGYEYRVGCEVHSNNEVIEENMCDPNLQGGNPYTKEYTLVNKRSNSKLFIRKHCCFDTLCNVPDTSSPKKWFSDKESFPMSKIKSSSSMFYFLKYSVFIGSFTYLIIFYLKMRILSSNNETEEYMSFIGSDIEAISELNPKNIVDTKLQASGRLKLSEVCEVLALLPEEAKMAERRSNSKSSEASTELVQVVTKVPSQSGKETVYIKYPLKVKATGWGHRLWSTSRVINSPCDLLYRLIEHGPYQYPFSALELLRLFEETAFKLSEEPSLLQIDAGIVVISDIRGRYVDLHRWLQLTGWPPRNRLLFLGGIIDNGEAGSIETLALICALKCRFPKHVYMLRGIPEMTPFKMAKRFHPLINNAIQSSVKRMCSHLPFACVIGKSILAVYSGFSPMIREKSDVKNLFRPVPMESLNSVEKHIIYNMPSSKVRMYRPNRSGKCDWFGKQAVKRACISVRASVMIRGQSIVPYGYLPCWNYRLINIWSAPGLGNEYGAVLNINSDLCITPIIMEAQHNQ